MPSPEQILAGLETTANQWRALAILWHVYFGVLALTLLSRRPPGRRILGVLLGLPLLSVSALAWTAANPFNGVVFAVAGTAALAAAWRLPARPARLARPWTLMAGVLLLAFGWIYPHFLEAGNRLAYLYASPLGLLPCPTLSAITGLSLAFEGLGSRTWAAVIGFAGLFYGVLGAAWLGVTLDWVLLAGAVLILTQSLAPHRAGSQDR